MNALKRLLGFFGRYLAALAGSLFLFTFGLVFRRHRGMIHALYRHFFHASPAAEPLDLRPAEPSEIADPETEIRILEPEWKNGNVSLSEMILLNQWVKKNRPEALFEIGTFDGRTTLNLAANAPEHSKVYTLDLPAAEVSATRLELDPGDRVHVEKPASGERFRSRPETAKIVQLYGDSASFDFGPYEGRFDFVFIDASHAYGYVLNDTRAALRLLKAGCGAIFWHDYGTFAGVTRALNELSRSEVFRGIRLIRGTSLACVTLSGAFKSSADMRLYSETFHAIKARCLADRSRARE